MAEDLPRRDPDWFRSTDWRRPTSATGETPPRTLDNGSWRTPGRSAPRKANTTATPPKRTRRTPPTSSSSSPIQDDEDEDDTPPPSVDRRIYLGNLLYSVTPDELWGVLRAHGFDADTKLHISVDPVTGRNPGYCFVDFANAATASQALVSLPGAVLRNRPLKVGPCQPKGDRPPGRHRDANYRPTFNRWGDWKGEARRRGQGHPEGGVALQGPYAALGHLDEMGRSEAHSRRVYVGGLGPMLNQETHDVEVRELLKGFEVEAVSKRITPHESTRSKPGNHHYCFVDFVSPEEANAVVAALNGREYKTGRLKVSLSKPGWGRQDA